MSSNRSALNDAPVSGPHPPGPDMCYHDWPALGHIPSLDQGQRSAKAKALPSKRGRVILQREIRVLLVEEAGVDSGQPEQQTYTSLWVKKATVKSESPGSEYSILTAFLPCLLITGFSSGSCGRDVQRL